LPILWNDNYFSLLPGENKEVKATFAAKDLNGVPPAVEVGGWNILRIEDDLNGDRIVNIIDVCIVARAFGSRPWDLNWKEITDLDKNGVIDIIDFTIVAEDFGKKL